MSKKRHRAIVVGAGNISNAWFGPLKQEQVHVAAVVDLRREMAEARIAEHQLDALASDDLDRVLRDIEADFLIDLTAPEAHCQVTCGALNAGLHVLGEKPMASRMEDARRMVETSGRTGKLYMVSQSRRWMPMHDQVRRTLATGQLGRLTTMNCDFYLGAHFEGFRDQMPSPLILDMAIHHFDLARYFADADARTVYAHEFNPAGSWYTGDAAATCVFEMTGGVVFTYRGSWCAEGCATSWNGHWRLIGERGTLLYEKDQPPFGEIAQGDDGFMRPVHSATITAPTIEHQTMHGALREMLAFLETGRRPMTECGDNIKSLAMVFAAMQSAREKKRITLDPPDPPDPPRDR